MVREQFVSQSFKKKMNTRGFSNVCELERREETMRLILLLVLILLLIGALPTWPYSTGWGYYPSGGLGLVLLIIIVLLVAGRI